MTNNDEQGQEREDRLSSPDGLGLSLLLIGATGAAAVLAWTLDAALLRVVCTAVAVACALAANYRLRDR